MWQCHPLRAGPRRIIASRACDEVPEGAIANLGIGMPEGVARIAAERGLLSRFTLTVESGSGITVYASVIGAYQTGESSVASSLLAERALVELRLNLQKLRVDHAIAWARVEEIVGRPVDAVEGPTHE